ncbi:hypothetical protein HPB50_025664 [Hyalomma asiaticum]|uniref:Uncharacterized protein n=1 Tax=Hyalomma asiaticum TaxID=266040 RepID=A0ACB7SCD7_HYAAI|nr:hypothetical protein HPB50_025664 [Hyalomma asiaticum]
MPYFVLDTYEHLPGIAGLFVTAVYSGSLSTMSSGYNALAAITWEDFLKPKLKLSPRGIMWATKAIAAGYGLLTVVIAFLAGSLPSIMSTALLSMATGLGLSFWVAVGSMLYPAKPVAVRTTLEQCTFNYTTRVPIHRTSYSGGIYELYHISYMWIPVISFLTTFVVAILITLLCGLKDSDDVDTSLIAPFMRKLYLRTRSTRSDEQKCRPPKVEDNVIEKPAQKLRDIVTISNGHVNYAMTNDDGTQHTAM